MRGERSLRQGHNSHCHEVRIRDCVYCMIQREFNRPIGCVMGSHKLLRKPAFSRGSWAQRDETYDAIIPTGDEDPTISEITERLRFHQKVERGEAPPPKPVIQDGMKLRMVSRLIVSPFADHNPLVLGAMELGPKGTISPEPSQKVDGLPVGLTPQDNRGVRGVFGKERLEPILRSKVADAESLPGRLLFPLGKAVGQSFQGTNGRASDDRHGAGPNVSDQAVAVL